MMPEGSLTRHFGVGLLEIIAGRLGAVWPDFPQGEFVRRGGELEELGLMARVAAIAGFLSEVLPRDLSRAWIVMRDALPRPLDAKGKTFNDGYWTLPLAAFWGTHGLSDFDTTVTALEELTQRGTCEFAVREVICTYPGAMEAIVDRWVVHESFHVRRLASEGTRPYLPWSGKLAVSAERARRYLEAISPLAKDPSSYVRRSVGNHVRDWRRIDPSVADRWIEEHDPPRDVARLTSARR